MCASGVKLALHKDWVVVVSDKNSVQLTELNASMRRVDLLCAIGAPLAVSMFSAYASTAIALVHALIFAYYKIDISIKREFVLH